MSRVIVVGAGISGIISAISHKKNNIDDEVIILERNNQALKKLLLTGNGKCNYYNDDQSIIKYHSNNDELLKDIITEKNLKKVLEFWNSIGIIPKIKNGYYYPVTNTAYSVKSALLCEIKRLDIKILFEKKVINIRKNDLFEVITEDEIYTCDKLIISSGGKSYSKTGSDGLGYDLLLNFGHKIIKPLPSLVQLVGNASYYKDWSGIRSDVKLSLYEDDILTKEECGEIQLTDFGISGIVTYNLSGNVSKNISTKKETIRINFLPYLNIIENAKLVEYIDERNNKLNNRSIDELFDGLIHYKLILLMLKLSNLQNKHYWNELDNYEKLRLCDNLINFEFIPVDTKGFDFAQVTKGGVSLDEINLNNFESKLVSNLFIVGEVVDIDGDCGGYNITFATLSGILAGENND